MKTIPAAQFEAISPIFSKLPAASELAARAVLVQGLQPSEAARLHGISRQRLNGVLARFKAAISSVPPGWKRVQVWLPPATAFEVERMAQSLFAAHQE